MRRGADGQEETLDVVRAVADPDNVAAKFAMVVRSDLKGRGLGRLLLAKMVAFLARQGTRRVAGYVMPENLAMRGLALKVGFVVDPAVSDADARVSCCNYSRWCLHLISRALSPEDDVALSASRWKLPSDLRRGNAGAPGIA